jgi:hypothetical protein
MELSNQVKRLIVKVKAKVKQKALAKQASSSTNPHYPVKYMWYYG